ncbi:MAG: DUF484 family protein [Burkholderiales bacterium]|jgi:uncharacterized protein|nr:DUF484 family protein [Burkholderiales bacterium]
MNPNDVAAYLKEHPDFFENYADVVADVMIPHPHGGRTISISERQILTLRERAKQLEAKLGELIQFGEENDAIGEKVHRLAVALLGARSDQAVIDVAGYNLREDFTVPHVALTLWHPAAAAAAASEATRSFTAGLLHPHCGPQAMADTAALFGEAAPLLKSFAYVALRGKETFGLLALASEDAQRFYPEMGTLYLTRIGELVAAGLLRHLEAA